MWDTLHILITTVVFTWLGGQVGLWVVGKRPPRRDSFWTLTFANLIPQYPLQAAAQPQPRFVNAYRKNIEIDPLDPDQTIATTEKIPQNAKIAARALLAGLTGQETSQIDFFAEEPSKELLVEARKCARAATNFMTRRRPPKHNNPPAQPMLIFDHILADLEMKLLLQYRLLLGTLTQIVKRDWIATLKFNLISFINIFDTICQVDITRALMDTMKQGNLLKVQSSIVKHPGYNRQMLRSLRTLLQTEDARPTLVGTLITRIIGFTAELDQEIKKLTAQQVINLIRCKPEIIPSEWTQDFTKKPTPETELIAFLLFYSQLQQQSLNPYTPLNRFTTNPLKRQPMQFPIQLTQFPAISPLNPFLPTMNPTQTQIYEPQFPSNENVRDNKMRFNRFNKQNEQQRRQLKDRDLNEQQPEIQIIYQFHKYRHIPNNGLLEYLWNVIQQREFQIRDRVIDQYLKYTRKPINLKRKTF
ncbi:MAG: hypothetical protein EZS28_006026 [Streblomastix strix]|uniref:Uncharacterized protein n=1 Tax=Streblomastix strix TaxID=222440 RepID=A0A5J4WUH6_9EUKA|nr:MAG: hypothetical protein EZS28_006026 [Streblomastix strix]